MERNAVVNDTGARGVSLFSKCFYENNRMSY
ncbi:hypothetical protein COL11_14065 [Bacillus anthracis]|nr:hypothetical protein CON22_10970 [Bacillus cereus]PEU76598.1 hypothetical protein CN394_24040 [Bacillus anthracis]PEZ24663.1 hypothetical protein CN337_07475 [Bacillus anthracis]PEZ73894.1 hypothetical protein CN410_17930 [Bacillus anthracis]PFR87828.1 hypothetical protein COK43_21450 [Bacillus cereus]